jgi:hypothetical protein
MTPLIVAGVLAAALAVLAAVLWWVFRSKEL